MQGDEDVLVDDSSDRGGETHDQHDRKAHDEGRVHLVLTAGIA